MSGVVRGPNDDPRLSDDELLAHRRAWFEFYAVQGNVVAGAEGGPYTCPCCGHPTLGERGAYEICDECGWEDDGQDDADSDVVRGGANGRLSLDQARREFVECDGSPRLHTPPAPPR